MPADTTDTEPDADLSKSFDQDIKEHVMPNLSKDALRYFAGPLKPKKGNKPKKKDGTSKRKKSPTGDDSISSPDSDDASDNGRTKKARGDDTDGGLAVEVTVFIHVLIPSEPSAASSRGRSSKSKAPETTSIPRGPFFFKADATWEQFLIELANTTPCRRDNINVRSLTWQFDKPANSKPKLLADAAGYKAMIKCLQERKKDHVIKVSMPQPVRDDVSWDTGKEEKAGNTKGFELTDAEVAFTVGC
ncbi:hypothetical protein BV25DRAFT_1833626 [Artomyces pyxidatus]|uniref:Uncharacterized protein n=1 Tax=Artomyces pyxidatus TaxID=48021 RepID=A0ACB8SD78_9AGAM|nr:hypothetical protein BV25DRAFT_1833626 [Artomyces pyxidatus]